jgi:hypothetical protein
MAHVTEAACLLESGAKYPERIGLRPSNGDPIFAGFKQGAFSLYFGDDPIYHFDLEGRWQRAFVAGTHYLKGLDTTTQAIDRVREGDNLVLKRRTLSIAEASKFDARVRATALELIAALDAGRLDRVSPPPKAEPLDFDKLRRFLEQVARWDASAWSSHRTEYDATYGPLPFVPPHGINAILLQATLGDESGRSFGGGQGGEYHVRSPEEFEEHVRRVFRLLGRRVEQCRDVFLAGSDVLRQPPDAVSAYLERVPAAGAIQAFLEDFRAPRPDRATWQRWSELNLRRITLGVESGDPGIRGLYGKVWQDEDLQTLVADLRASELIIGLIVLVGAGGAEHAGRHVEATADLIQSLDLGPGGFAALVDAHELCDLEQGPALGVTPLSLQARLDQLATLRERLGSRRTGRKVKVVPYSLEKQALS